MFKHIRNETKKKNYVFAVMIGRKYYIDGVNKNSFTTHYIHYWNPLMSPLIPNWNNNINKTFIKNGC